MWLHGTRGSPWLYTCFYGHQMITQQAQGSLGVVGGHSEIAIFQPTHNGVKTASGKSSPVGPNTGGKFEIAAGTPIIG